MKTVTDIKNLLASESAVPVSERQLILSHVLVQPRSWLIAHDTDAISEVYAHDYHAKLTRREAGEPIAYIVGYKDFWKHRFAVNPATLIPRPETELLVELALSARAATPCHVLDLGTGSGAIAVSLADERRQWSVLANDISASALKVARGNSRSLANLQFFNGCWTDAVAFDSVDMIVSNPPYIAPDDNHLPGLTHEPRGALVSAEAGMSDIESIVTGSRKVLVSGGTLVLEHGYCQQDAVCRTLEVAGYEYIELFNDLGGIPRAVRAKRP